MQVCATKPGIKRFAYGRLLIFAERGEKIEFGGKGWLRITSGETLEFWVLR